MIEKTVRHQCGRCGGSNLLLTGHSRSGKEQYLCKDCRCSRVLQPTPRGYSAEERERALRVY